MTEQARSGRDGLRYAVALIEIWGGLNGLWGLAHDIETTASKIPVTLMPGIAIIALVLIASVVAGVALWHDRRWGYTLSIPVQLFQVVWFVSAGLTFRIAASGWMLADLLLRYAGDGLVLAWQLDLIHKGAYALSLAPREEITVAVNLVALAILVWLAIQLRRS
ncbi:hypothetical protein HCU64_17225 [Methylobacterium sp. C25]|uniref:hypothetical protein n=1 Tax=Methylobacterium sp. C25 TaxID=2721622 RepID=UPI001F1D2041|nr:hypothetical protein [Methylobacterium sp. C25]MCE4225498.1 hypothetical protein [Methylobacterium sp. C25]